MNLKSKKYMFVHQVWFIVRRLIYAAAAVFALKQLWLINMLVFYPSMASLIIVGMIKPFEAVADYRLELLNEALFLTIMYHVMCFTELVPSIPAKNTMGWSCMIFTIIAIMINFIVVFLVILRAMILHVKRFVARRQHSKLKRAK